MAKKYTITTINGTPADSTGDARIYINDYSTTPTLAGGTFNGATIYRQLVNVTQTNSDGSVGSGTIFDPNFSYTVVSAYLIPNGNFQTTIPINGVPTLHHNILEIPYDSLVGKIWVQDNVLTDNTQPTIKMLNNTGLTFQFKIDYIKFIEQSSK